MEEKSPDEYTDDQIREQIRNFYKNIATQNEFSRERIQVLVVDDEERSLHTFQRLMKKEFDVHTATSAQEAKSILDSGKTIHVIVSDQRMPEMTGIAFLQSILAIHKDPIRILLTGYTDIDAVIDAINKGEVYRYVNKPFTKDDMVHLIENAYEVYYLRKKTEKLTRDLAITNKQLEFMIRNQLLDE